MKPSKLTRLTNRLIRAARAALHAQERYYYWTQFGTNSQHCRTATAKWEKSQMELDRCEAEIAGELSFPSE
jgi:hypothetical protein